jgi:ApaG protein
MGGIVAAKRRRFAAPSLVSRGGGLSVAAAVCRSWRLVSQRKIVCNRGMTKKYEITVGAHASFVPEQSNADEGRFVFAYTITITNTGSVAARLISRHWIITDSDNKVQEVRGLGVVGEQPLLQPQESFEYTSGAAIATPVGTMRGSYQMVAEDGNSFDAPIPEFMLSMPRVLH